MTAPITPALLYLDNVTVSFDGFRALNALSLTVDNARDARDHRPERRRQDDDDGRHHRQDAADRRLGACSRARTTSPSSTRPRSPSSASDGNSRRRQSSTCILSRTTCSSRSRPIARRSHPCCHAAASKSASASTRCWNACGSRITAGGRPPNSRMARSNGSRSACCLPRNRACFWLTSLRPG